MPERSENSPAIAHRINGVDTRSVASSVANKPEMNTLSTIVIPKVQWQVLLKMKSLHGRAIDWPEPVVVLPLSTVEQWPVAASKPVHQKIE